MLATGALIASLLVVGATPAGADTDKADNTADTSACVGAALDAHMFDDVSDEHAFDDAIRCIAYYRITNGTGDGSTYSPNRDVTRAEMAVFIARAAEAAGVDLGDAMDAGFSDIGDTWSGAQDAINRLGSKGMIPKGGEFRPDDAITRAEMATFLVGLLNKAAANVTIDSDGAIQLGVSGSTSVADDHFADARASQPRSNDAEISAIYELGITKGASAAAVQDDTKAPLDYNYEPSGTVNRGQMAAFITRALAHTSVRPEGVTAQYDGSDVVVSVRDDKFQPKSNTVVDVFTTDAAGADLALRADGTCGEVGKVSNRGKYQCEIDGDDPITGGDGNTRVPLGGVDDGGTVVWAWTGDSGDTVDDDTVLFRLDIDEGEEESMATKASVSTEHTAAKAHLGKTVLYTIQLQDDDGDVTVGKDGKKPASFLVKLITTAYVGPAGSRTLNPQGSSLVTTLPLTTGDDGSVTFSAAGGPDTDPDVDAEEYHVQILIQPRPDGNAGSLTPTDMDAPLSFVNGDGDDLQPYLVDSNGDGTPDRPTGESIVGEVIFSTEDSSRDASTVSVESDADHVAAAARGASNRATVTVADQYGDPLPGQRVWLTSDVDTTPDDTTDNEVLVIAGGRALAVGRDGTYTFGYEREGDDNETETLIAHWDHDGDGCSAADVANTAFTSWSVHLNNDDDTGNDVTWDHDGDSGTDEVLVTKNCFDQRPVIDLDGDGDVDQPGTAGDDAADRPIANFKGSAPKMGDAVVQWAETPALGASATATDYIIQEFDKDTNTIFVAIMEDLDSDPLTPDTVMADSAVVVRYDSNDRFDIDGESGTYAGFGNALKKGRELSWNLVARGSRAINAFTVSG